MSSQTCLCSSVAVPRTTPSGDMTAISGAAMAVPPRGMPTTVTEGRFR
eukprot:CAMPEP_0171217742 /NCGR_PEP_ID=MMETSP0790-20130122/32845_1 /TAXON_ID=2925 /ORGANISM="Alexandrium catenella, Strain OF101" /LENGTH=47 /DNA_ID= /DNA_START= /DNA_END= /DNA_ORIENTATION=